jgi:hypothetical protein
MLLPIPALAMTPLRLIAARWAASCFALLVFASALRAADNDASTASEARLLETVRYLASDELEGRGVGTPGIDAAADYIARRFAEAGLKTDLVDGSPFQPFPLVTGIVQGEDNRLALVGPASDDNPAGTSVELALGTDFTPLAMGASGEFDVPIVYVGYGITDPHIGYDDYAGLDVSGKAVIVLRHEPQQENAASAFNGTQDSPHAVMARKVSNAYQHGAAVVVFCTDTIDLRRAQEGNAARLAQAVDELLAENEKFKALTEPAADAVAAHRIEEERLLKQLRESREALRAGADPVLNFYHGLQGFGRPNVPVVHCRRAVLDSMLNAALSTDLAQLEIQIDQGPTPKSAELVGWRLRGNVNVVRQETTA